MASRRFAEAVLANRSVIAATAAATPCVGGAAIVTVLILLGLPVPAWATWGAWVIMILVVLVLMVVAFADPQRTSTNVVAPAGEMRSSFNRRPALPDWLAARLQHAAALLCGIMIGLSGLVVSSQDPLPIWSAWHRGTDLIWVSIFAGLLVAAIEVLVEPIRPRLRWAAELHKWIGLVLLLSGLFGGTIAIAAAFRLTVGFVQGST